MHKSMDITAAVFYFLTVINYSCKLNIAFAPAGCTIIKNVHFLKGIKKNA
jgi:hypothetical protein